jgi:hypothetical protein
MIKSHQISSIEKVQKQNDHMDALPENLIHLRHWPAENLHRPGIYRNFHFHAISRLFPVSILCAAVAVWEILLSLFREPMKMNQSQLWILWSLSISSLCSLIPVFASSNKVKYDPLTKEDMAKSYNFIIHGDWGWNSVNQSWSAYQMGVYGDIIQNKFVVALGDNVSVPLFFLPSSSQSP